MKNFFIDFGFKPIYHQTTVIKRKKIDKQGELTDVDLSKISYNYNYRSNNPPIIWTVLIYIFLSLGIFFRRTVNFPEPLSGINIAVFKLGIIAASFIIGLAVLAPLLRIISKFHKGKLSWHHCLTAFSIGFFGNLTFEILINGFINILK